MFDFLITKLKRKSRGTEGKVEERKKERDGSERNGDRSTAGAGHSDVFQRPPQAPLHATSVGARVGDGSGSSVRESAGKMGRSAPTRPRQNARKGQGCQRAPLLRSR
ncbi:hypothetical protein REPUB_Repub01dG0270700 [Reevesia pubescens]